MLVPCTWLELLSTPPLCLRQPCDGTELLTFPSCFRRERQEQPIHPSVLLTYLKRQSADGKTVKQILFDGERFDVMSVWRWREKVLAQLPADAPPAG